MFRRSRFYVTVLLIIFFVLFVVFPDIVEFYIRNNRGGIVQPEGLIIQLLLYDLAFLFDAWVYIFMNDPIKKLLVKKLRSLWYNIRSRSRWEHLWRRTFASRTSVIILLTDIRRNAFCISEIYMKNN